jgi:hypothetical protein
MAAPANHHFSRPVTADPSDQYAEDKLFRVDRAHNALTINPGANNYVRTVTDDPGSLQWDQALQAVGVAVLGQLPGAAGVAVRAAYIRSALRPAGQGGGRPRFR